MVIFSLALSEKHGQMNIFRGIDSPEEGCFPMNKGLDDFDAWAPGSSHLRFQKNISKFESSVFKRYCGSEQGFHVKRRDL